MVVTRCKRAAVNVTLRYHGQDSTILHSQVSRDHPGTLGKIQEECHRSRQVQSIGDSKNCVDPSSAPSPGIDEEREHGWK